MTFGLFQEYDNQYQYNCTNDANIYLVVLLTIAGGIFSKEGSGAVFAMVPLIQRRLPGQIAGMVGAFGNVGAVKLINGYTPANNAAVILGSSNQST
jgi:nitrate/nitrite transporter NarK